jgi:hypothetical protein
MNIAIDLGTVLQNDAAAVQISIPVYCTRNDDIAVKANNVALHRPLDSDRTAKGSQVSTFNFMCIDNDSTAK